MKAPIVIDKEIYKIMRYTYRHHEVPVHELEKKFGKKASSHVFYLCKIEYGAYRGPDGSLTYDPAYMHGNGTFGLVAEGNVYVENRVATFWHWFVPTLLSFFALVTSVASLILSFRGGEIVVRLIQ